MSHFLVVVILPKDIPYEPGPDGTTLVQDLEYEVEKLLNPYSENLEVDPYEVDCGCIGYTARDAIYKQLEADPRFGTADQMKEKFNAAHPDGGGSYYEEVGKPWSDEFDRLLAEHPDKDKPDPTCTECGGTGRHMSTYNPNSKWDWYMVGGRWDGWLTDTEVESETHETLETNSLTVTEGLDKIPFAILTPKGEWGERGEMGWFGCTSNEMSDEDWTAAAKAIYSMYVGHIAVAVDCHM